MISDLYILDYVLLIITLLFIFFSVWKGFIQSILGLMTWIGSIIITLIFYENLTYYLANKLNGFEFLESTGLSDIIGIILSIRLVSVIFPFFKGTFKSNLRSIFFLFRLILLLWIFSISNFYRYILRDHTFYLKNPTHYRTRQIFFPYLFPQHLLNVNQLSKKMDYD